ncbi:hypothetical protein SLS53_009197 [Cytospora paraplurivora]|uniref:Uncharacterized protein n=1 Tax=Cytospora paraplurivora TaxID=2898453 RepID=A0AAN9YCC0_9PEZI
MQRSHAPLNASSGGNASNNESSEANEANDATDAYVSMVYSRLQSDIERLAFNVLCQVPPEDWDTAQSRAVDRLIAAHPELFRATPSEIEGSSHSRSSSEQGRSSATSTLLQDHDRLMDLGADAANSIWSSSGSDHNQHLLETRIETALQIIHNLAIGLLHSDTNRRHPNNDDDDDDDDESPGLLGMRSVDDFDPAMLQQAVDRHYERSNALQTRWQHCIRGLLEIEADFRREDRRLRDLVEAGAVLMRLSIDGGGGSGDGEEGGRG